MFCVLICSLLFNPWQVACPFLHFAFYVKLALYTAAAPYSFMEALVVMLSGIRERLQISEFLRI